MGAEGKEGFFAVWYSQERLLATIVANKVSPHVHVGTGTAVT